MIRKIFDTYIRSIRITGCSDSIKTKVLIWMILVKPARNGILNLLGYYPPIAAPKNDNDN